MSFDSNENDFHCFNCHLASDTKISLTETTYDELFIHFGHNFIDQQSFLQRLPILFNIARQYWARIERFFSSYHHNKEEDWLDIRNNILKFLWSFKKIINSLSYEERQHNFPVVMRHLTEFYQNAGLLNKLNWSQSFGGNYSHHTKENSVYHFLHLNLDLRWMMVLILSDIEELGIANNDYLLLDKVLQDLIWDLVGVSFIRFSNLTLQDYIKTDPYSCLCIPRFWEKVIHFIDLRHAIKQTDYFWLMLHGAFSEIRCQEFGFFSKLLSKVSAINELGFCWWLLFHLASLYQNDIFKTSYMVSSSNRNVNTFINFSNHFELNCLLKMTFFSESGGYSELHLRCYLHCCVKILKMWEPSIEAPLLMWDYYSKRLNENFKQSDDVVMTYFHGKSGLHFKRMTEEITRQLTDNQTQLNSFQLFLKMLANFLNNAHSKNFGWKEIQQKVASKLTARLVQTSNTHGLYNFCCLILVLGSSGDLTDTIKIFTDSVVTPNSYVSDGGKSTVIWRTYFALIFYCMEQRIDISILEKKILDNMKCLIRDLPKIGGHLHSGHWSTDLLMTYFESLKDLFKEDLYLKVSLTFLLDFGFMEVMSYSPESVASIVLSCFEILIPKLIRLIEEHCCTPFNGKSQYETISTSIFNLVYPWIKKLVCTDLNQRYGLSYFTLSSVAVGLSELRYKCSAKVAYKENFKMFITYFCFNEQLGHDFVCQYVVKLISIPSLLIEAKKEIMDFETKIIKLWFQLGFKMSTSSLHYIQFCRSLTILPEMKNLFNQVQIPVIEFRSHSEAVSELLKVFSAHFIKNVNVMQIRYKVAAYMTDLKKIVKDTLISNKLDEIMRIYQIVGEIFQKISPLIYIRSKPDCLLHEFVSQLLLPSIAYSQNSKVSPAVLAALKENLCLFIEGISNLDFVGDSYIGRTIKDIFSQYLYRFPLSPCLPNMALHPLFISLITVQQKNKRYLGFLIRIMEGLRDYYIIRRDAHPQLDMCLLFMKDVIIRCPTKDRCSLCPVLLTPLLKLMMVPNTRDIATEVVQLLADSLPVLEDNSIEELFRSLKQIIYEHFRSYQTVSNIIFHFLILVSKKYRLTVQNLNVVIGEIIAEREKLICGNDESLRQRYSEFLCNLDRPF